MNREQFTKAKAVIEQDATLGGAFFDGAGGACAVGGLFMFLHPEMEDEDFVHVSTEVVEKEVGMAFGLTQREISAIEQVNDSHDSDESDDIEPEPDDYMVYEFVDGVNGSTHEVYTLDRDLFEQAVDDYENREVFPNEGVIAERRLDLISHLDSVCQEYDEGTRTADWYGP
jgi:hypothetical protein